MNLNNYKDKFTVKMHEVVDVSFLDDVSLPEVPRPEIPGLPELPVEFEHCAELESNIAAAMDAVDEGIDKINAVKDELFSAIEGLIQNNVITKTLKKIKKGLDNAISKLKDAIPDFPDFPEFPELPDMPDLPFDPTEFQQTVSSLTDCVPFAGSAAGEGASKLLEGMDALENVSNLDLNDEVAKRMTKMMTQGYDMAMQKLMDSTPLGKLDSARKKMEDSLGITAASDAVSKAKSASSVSVPTEITGKVSMVEDLVSCLDAVCESYNKYQEKVAEEKLKASLNEEGVPLLPDQGEDSEVPEHLQKEVAEQEALKDEIKYKLDICKEPDKKFPHLGKKLGIKIPLVGGNEEIINATIDKKYDVSTGKFSMSASGGKAGSGTYSQQDSEIILSVFKYPGTMTCDTELSSVSDVTGELETVVSGSIELSLGSHFEVEEEPEPEKVVFPHTNEDLTIEFKEYHYERICHFHCNIPARGIKENSGKISFSVKEVSTGREKARGTWSAEESDMLMDIMDGEAIRFSVDQNFNTVVPPSKFKFSEFKINKGHTSPTISPIEEKEYPFPYSKNISIHYTPRYGDAFTLRFFASSEYKKDDTSGIPKIILMGEDSNTPNLEMWYVETADLFIIHTPDKSSFEGATGNNSSGLKVSKSFISMGGTWNSSDYIQIIFEVT